MRSTHRAKATGLLLGAVVLAGCGSSSVSGTGAIHPTSATPSAGAPATAQVSFGGDPALAVPLTKLTVVCLQPRITGMAITVTGLPQGQPQDGFFVLVTVQDGTVTVRVNTGSGATYTERDFTGTGTGGFNPATGVQLSGPMSETTGVGVNKGAIGAVTSITGSIQCGGQTAGSSTIRLTGALKEGPVDAVPSPVRVVCSSGASGLVVGITGIASLPGGQGLVIITLGQASLQVFETSAGGPQHFFSAQGHVGTTLTTTGGHVEGDVSEAAAAGATPHQIHLSGDATCGSTITH